MCVWWPGTMTAGDERALIGQEPHTLAPGAVAELDWTVPDTGGQPFCAIGVEVSGAGGVSGAVSCWTG